MKNRNAMAARYAKRHRAIDAGILEIHHLPAGAPDDEIRLLEVNAMIPEIDQPEPIDFGVNGNNLRELRLVVLDVTPRQWRALRREAMPLPPGWSLEGSREVGR